jgi:hypothetical protein
MIFIYERSEQIKNKPCIIRLTQTDSTCQTKKEVTITVSEISFHLTTSQTILYFRHHLYINYQFLFLSLSFVKYHSLLPQSSTYFNICINSDLLYGHCQQGRIQRSDGGSPPPRLHLEKCKSLEGYG